MNTIFKLAQRNIWRNKRRTVITSAAIMFAVFAAIAMSSVQKGIWDNMERGMVNSFIGYAQIHGNGYWEDQSLDYAFSLDEHIEQSAAKHKTINSLVPRLESFALAANETHSRGSLIIGIEPAKEDDFTQLSQKLIDGEFINNGDISALIAEGLAKSLKLNVDDTLVLTSQGYHGANAAGLYPIKGIIKMASPELNKQMVYLPLPLAQEFFAAYGMVSSVVLNMDSPKKVKDITANLSADIGETYEVMDYEQLIPELLQAREMDEAGGTFMLLILYVIITFGIFGTILMMIKERQYEFGVLTAIGMKRSSISTMVWLETVFLGFLGTLAGILLASPIVIYFNMNPMPLEGDAASAYEKFGVEPVVMSSTDPMIFINQALIVFIIVTILAIYPMRKISKLQPVESMRA